MKPTTLAGLLSLAIATTGMQVMAQQKGNNPRPTRALPAAQASQGNGPSGGSSMTSGSPAPAIPTHSNAPADTAVAAPQNGDDGGIHISMSEPTNAARPQGQVQLEGRLVDMNSIRTGTANPGGSAADAGFLPNDAAHNPGSGPASGRGEGMIGSIGTHVPLPNSGTAGAVPSAGVAPPGVGESFGTYDHPGATAGTGNGGLQTGMQGNGITGSGPVALHNGATPADDKTGTGTGSMVNGGNAPAKSVAAANAPQVINDAQTIRQHLQQGVPAALIANGHVYTLRADAKQLAAYAGESVRISGEVDGQSLTPNKFEVKKGTAYETITLATPQPATGGNAANRTANER